MSFDLGDLVRCAGAFTTAAGVAVDPSVVTFTWRGPSGVIASYVYGVDAQLIKDATGNYHVDLSATAAGTWQYRFIGSGAVGQAARGGDFEVASSNV